MWLKGEPESVVFLWGWLAIGRYPVATGKDQTMAVDSSPPHGTRQTVLLLACCQALSMTSNSVLFSAGALVGKSLAPQGSLATLPLALLHVATMSSTLPAAILMQRLGRRLAFILGAMVALSGVGLGIYSVLTRNFVSFCLATILFGTFNAFIAQYRFAAAEIAEESFRSRAISLVVAGGIFAALVGPPLTALTKDLFAAEFAGSLSCILVLLSVVIGLLSQVRLPRVSISEGRDTGRPLVEIMRQPTFIVAVLSSMLGYGVMVLVMTATPLAMDADAYPFGQTAFVIQWHVLGMFAPSLITGSLIARYGVLNIILTGGILNLLCVATNTMGTDLGHYWFSLLALGVGWNFMFVGSTTLLTQTYVPAERAKTQAVHDFLMFSCVALSALGSGDLLNDFGWRGVNWAGFPMILVAMGTVIGLQLRRPVQVETGQ